MLAAAARGVDSCPMEGCGTVIPIIVALGLRRIDGRLEPRWRRPFEKAVVVHGMNKIVPMTSRAIEKRYGMLQITPQERTTLLLLANGISARELADRFGVTLDDMEARLTTLFARMGAASRDEAIAVAWRRGLIDAHPAAGSWQRSL